MRRELSAILTFASLASSLALCGRASPPPRPQTAVDEVSRTLLGFDRNDYPGDDAVRLLKETFSFSGFWLSAPPGEKLDMWKGKRQVLESNGFGFLVLFNGRLDRELKSSSAPTTLGVRDAEVAVASARTEGFPTGTIIFLDQEEGGRMLSEQRAYVYAWVDGINASGYRSGIYCSGMPVKEIGGATMTTATDLHDNAGGREITFFVYNDSCPPSPGCNPHARYPSPQNSGVPFATIWQFAQSPRRREFTGRCSTSYDADGNCYAPLLRAAGVHIDLDSATTPDPSHGRR